MGQTILFVPNYLTFRRIKWLTFLLLLRDELSKARKQLNEKSQPATVTVTVVKHNGIVKSHTFQNVSYSYRQAQQ